MSTEEDYRLREIQREYLDFLDDDVGEACVLYRYFWCCWWKLNATGPHPTSTGFSDPGKQLLTVLIIIIISSSSNNNRYTEGVGMYPWSFWGTYRFLTKWRHYAATPPVVSDTGFRLLYPLFVTSQILNQYTKKKTIGYNHFGVQFRQYHIYR